MCMKCKKKRFEAQGIMMNSTKKGGSPMKHALVIGGTGMLAKVTLYLAENDYHVSVVGRNYEKMQMLINKSINPSNFSAVMVDYRNRVVFEKALQEQVTKYGPFHYVVAWIHSRGKDELSALFRSNIQNSGWELLHIIGSRSDSQGIRNQLDLPDCCVYRQVQLGFIEENNQSRWLTNMEIANGIISVIKEGTAKYLLIGQLDGVRPDEK